MTFVHGLIGVCSCGLWRRYAGVVLGLVSSCLVALFGVVRPCWYWSHARVAFVVVGPVLVAGAVELLASSGALRLCRFVFGLCTTC